jgi:hypothetical protein
VVEVTNKPSAVHHFLYSQLLIALSAMALTLQTYWQLELTPQWDKLVLFIGGATLFTYLLQRQMAIWWMGGVAVTPLLRYFMQHSVWVIVLMVLSVGLMVYGFTGIDTQLYPLLGIIGVISLGYNVPLGKKRLRAMGLLKIFLIAITWASVTVLMPAVHSGMSLHQGNVWMVWLERTLFILALTLPFDLRDVLTDKVVALTTVPTLIGKQATIRLSLFLLVGVWLVEFVRMFFFHHTALLLWQPLVGITGALIVTTWLIYQRPRIDEELYFYGLLDGTMCLQPLLIGAAVEFLPAVPW